MASATPLVGRADAGRHSEAAGFVAVPVRRGLTAARSTASTSRSSATGPGAPAGPEIPHEVVEATRQRYTEVYEGITGTTRAKSA